MPRPLKSDFPPPATAFESSGTPRPGRKRRPILVESKLSVTEQLKRSLAWYRRHPIDIARCAEAVWPRMFGKTYCLI
jgi:hypothetical protein